MTGLVVFVVFLVVIGAVGVGIREIVTGLWTRRKSRSDG